MANWVYRLDLRDLWKSYKENKITIKKLGKSVAKRIRKLPCYEIFEDKLESIAMGFEICVNNVEDFDSILKILYDWADGSLPTSLGQMQRKLCWIETI